MKKFFLIIIIMLFSLNVNTNAFAHCGACGVEDEVVACASASCTVDDLCESCALTQARQDTAAVLSADCPTVDCSSDNLCVQCQIDIEAEFM